MKRIVCTISVLLCLAAFFAAGQDVRTRAFWDKLAGNCVSLSYSFQTRAAVPVSGEGTAVIRGDCYYVNGNGMEIWCDGQTRWIVDRAAGEVVIEAVDASSSDWLTNPVACARPPAVPGGLSLLCHAVAPRRDKGRFLFF